MNYYKQRLAIIGVILSTSALGGSIDYLSQQDAEYLAHPAMVGKIGVSGAYYNPAGTVWLEDGLYIQLNNQTHLKKYSMEYDDYKFTSDKPSLVVPSMQLVKKSGDNAYFFHIGAIAGGGSVGYDGGIATFPEIVAVNPLFQQLGGKFVGGSTIHGKSYYIAAQAGIARKFTQTLSGAIGIRVVNAEREFKGEGNFEYLGGLGKAKFDIDSKREAFGVSGIFGLNYQPNDKLNIGLRYETETKLDFKNKEHKLKDGFVESTGNIAIGNAFYNTLLSNHAIKQWMSEGSGKRNLPAVAALGISYKLTNKLTLLSSGNFYFIKEAGDDIGNFDNHDNGYEVAVGLDYELNEKWTLMAGYQYTKPGGNINTYTDTDFDLDADMYSIGFKYNYSSQLDLMAGYSFVDYKDGKNLKNIGYQKRVNSLGLGLIYKF